MEVYLTPSARQTYDAGKSLFYGTENSAGLDLAADLLNVQDENTRHFVKWNTTKISEYREVELPYMELEFLDTVRIPTGIFIKPDLLHFGMLALRSGFASKSGCMLTNGVGIIDPDYRGEILVSVRCFSRSKVVIHHGDRIAQLLFLPFRREKISITPDWIKFVDTERGTSGFGSTGQ